MTHSVLSPPCSSHPAAVVVVVGKLWTDPVYADALPALQKDGALGCRSGERSLMLRLELTHP